MSDPRSGDTPHETPDSRETPAPRETRPQPRWGQYAEVPPPPPAPVAPPSAPEPELPTEFAAPPKRRTFDIVVTTALLLFGVIDVATRWGEYADLGTTMRALYRLQDLGEFTAVGLADQVGGVINLVRAIVLIGAIVLSLLLIQRGRRAFWVPIAGAVLAFLITLAMLIFVMVSDPALADYVTRISEG